MGSQVVICSLVVVGNAWLILADPIQRNGGLMSSGVLILYKFKDDMKYNVQRVMIRTGTSRTARIASWLCKMMESGGMGSLAYLISKLEGGIPAKSSRGESNSLAAFESDGVPG